VTEEQPLLDLAAEAARLAGGLLLERAAAGSERGVASKSTPTDLVSEADLEAQRTIGELLRSRRPDDGFLGEEGGDDDGESAVYDPNRDELFTAGREAQARMVAPSGAVQLHGRAADPHGAGAAGEGLSTAMVATGLAYDAEVRERQARVLARLAGRVRDIRRFGSAALDLAWTAAGRFDAYYERSVKAWDIAAGELICRRAGLRVRELPEREGLPWGLMVAPAHLAGELHELVAGD
jgi:myo-inositol-1(or 4)-monophosphatase